MSHNLASLNTFLQTRYNFLHFHFHSSLIEMIFRSSQCQVYILFEALQFWNTGQKLLKSKEINFQLHHYSIFKKDWNHFWKWRLKWLTSRETFRKAFGSTTVIQGLISPKGMVMSKSLYNSNNLQNIKRYAAQQFLIVSWNVLSRSIQKLLCLDIFCSYGRLSTSLNYSFVSKHFSATLSVSIDSFWVWSDSKSTLKLLAWFLISLDFCQVFDNFLRN